MLTDLEGSRRIRRNGDKMFDAFILFKRILLERIESAPRKVIKLISYFLSMSLFHFRFLSGSLPLPFRGPRSRNTSADIILCLWPTRTTSKDNIRADYELSFFLFILVYHLLKYSLVGSLRREYLH